MFKTLLQNFQVIFEPVTISQLFHRVVLKKNVGEGMYLAFRSLEVKRAIIIANYFMVQSFKAWYSSAPGIIGMSLLPHHIGPFRMFCCFLAFQPRRGKLSLTDELHWADGFVVVYDISNRASFAFAKALLFRIQECQGGACKRQVIKGLLFWKHIGLRILVLVYAIPILFWSKKEIEKTTFKSNLSLPSEP